MNKLQEMTLRDYLALLASGAPAPGGGSAAALSGAQGAALGSMVTELSIGKKKYLDETERLTGARDALQALVKALGEDIDRDTQAFDAVSAAMKLPKDTDAEKARRTAAIQHALLAATHSPLAVCQKSLDALGQIELLIGHSNASAASDLGTGAAMLRAAAQGAWLNILINLSSLRDAQQVAALLAEGEALYRAALDKADAIFARIEAVCRPKDR